MIETQTYDSLIALTKSSEGLEKLNIICNVFAGTHTVKTKLIDGGEMWDVYDSDGRISQFTWLFCGIKKVSTDLQGSPLVPLTDSLDAIFAVEERLGLHKPGAWRLQEVWLHEASTLFFVLYGVMPEACELPHFKPTHRAIALVLTVQRLRKDAGWIVVNQQRLPTRYGKSGGNVHPANNEGETGKQKQ